MSATDNTMRAELLPDEWLDFIVDFVPLERHTAAHGRMLAILQAARADVARQVDGWQPIATAPKDGSQVLLARVEAEDGHVFGTVTQGHWQAGWGDAPDDMGCDDGFVSHDFDTFRPARSFGAMDYQHAGAQPTHWMPLPAPPIDNSAFSKPDRAPSGSQP